MNPEPLITVIVPVREGDGYSRLLASLRAQSYQAWDLIVEDGPDTPDSPADKRNRARASAIADGADDLLVIADADVTLYPETLRRWLSALRIAPDAAWAYSSFDRTGELDGIQHPVPINPGEDYEGSREHYTGTPCMVRAAACEPFPVINPREGDREWYSAMIAAGRHGVYVGPDPLYSCHYERGDLSTP